MKHKYFVQHHYFKMTFNNMLLCLFYLTSFLFNIIREIAITSAKTSYGQQIVACYVGNSILCWSHSLGGSAINDQTINLQKINSAYRQVTWSLSTNQMPIYKRLLSYPELKPGVTNPRLLLVAKMQKVAQRFNPNVTLQSRER